MSVEFIVI